jgi:hypothetical protein
MTGFSLMRTYSTFLMVVQSIRQGGGTFVTSMTDDEWRDQIASFYIQREHMKKSLSEGGIILMMEDDDEGC